MRTRHLLTLLALLGLVAVGSCETRSVPSDEPHPQAETAAAVVDALTHAYAAWRSDVEERDMELQSVGLSLNSWRFIPDPNLAEAMSTLPLPHGTQAGGALSPAAWTIVFARVHSPEPGKLVATIVDSAEPGGGLDFAVVVEPDGTVGDAYHVGFTTRGVSES